MQMVEELESTPYSMGPNSTALWLREFNNYRQYFAEDDVNFYETLKSFLGISFNKQWNSFMHWDENLNKVWICAPVAMLATSYSARQAVREEVLLHDCVQDSRLECADESAAHLA